MIKSGISRGVKTEKNGNKWLLVSALSSKDIIKNQVWKITVNIVEIHR